MITLVATNRSGETFGVRLTKSFPASANRSTIEKNRKMLFPHWHFSKPEDDEDRKRGLYTRSIHKRTLNDPGRRWTVLCPSDKSCYGRCSNRTEWRTQTKLTCYCDPDCYEVFNDCCTDYVRFCGAQKPKYVSNKKYSWSCEAVGHLDASFCKIGEGMWMVKRCPSHWPNDETRAKCERPTNKLTLDSNDLGRYIPLVDRKNVTFRNFYCALCNDADGHVDFWPVYIRSWIIPPKNYNIHKKIEFLLLNEGGFPHSDGPSQPGTSQARRYCISVRNVIDSCPNTDSEMNESCSNGSTAFVSSWFRGQLRHYKNFDCALCQSSGSSPNVICFPMSRFLRFCMISPQQEFTIKLEYSRTFENSLAETGSISVVDEHCGRRGMFLDNDLHVCVKSVSRPSKTGYDRFLVQSWLRADISHKSFSFTDEDFVHLWSKVNISTKELTFAEKDFQISMGSLLHTRPAMIRDVKISNITVRRISLRGTNPAFILVSCTITLTLPQSLLVSRYNITGNHTSENNMIKFLFFNAPFNVMIKNTNFTVIKTTSHQTEMTGLRVCNAEKSCLLGRCTENGSQLTLLSIHNFTIFRNLSIYRNETSILYHNGKYAIFPNSSVAVCDTMSKRNEEARKTSIRDDKVLCWITVFGFGLSIICHLVLIASYFMLQNIRTIPIKNLTNLAATLLMFEVFWLIPGIGDVSKASSLCTAVTIIEHYFLLAYFISMSVIAFHTYKIFAKNLPASPRPSEENDGKLFWIYASVVWLASAAFVAICTLLDALAIVHLGYGHSDICWLTGEDAHIYFVAIPIGTLLLFTGIAFSFSVFYLRKHSRDRIATRRALGQRPAHSLLLYVIISTLMGLTWLFFALLTVVAKPSTVVFWYMFVIVTSLQSVFIALAFVLNVKRLKLRRKSSMTFPNRFEMQVQSATASAINHRKSAETQNTTM